MTVATKLSGAFGVLVVILAALLVYHVRTNRQAITANRDLVAISSRLYVTTTRQSGAISRLQENADKYWVTRTDGYLELFDEALNDFEEALGALRGEALSVDERTETERLERMWREFRPVAGQLGDGILVSDPAAFVLRERLTTLQRQTGRVSNASGAAAIERLEASAIAARRAEWISWIAGAGALLLSVIVFTVIVRSISSALVRLQKGTREVSLGNFDYRLELDRDDEFADLARDFNVMTRRLGELDRMKRDFVSTVSHDLKTPLASMQEAVQAMLDGVTGPLSARQRRLLELTGQSARRLSAMITKILDLSALEAGVLHLELGAHEVRALVEPAVDALALGDPQQHRPIATNLPVEPLFIECDQDRTVQVLVNLLENAARFSPAGASVSISARRVMGDDPDVVRASRNALQRSDAAGEAVLIEVSDRGPGIPAADKARIFQRFFRSGRSDKASDRGVGLGLAICREIVELHGGALWVRDNPGGGSVFGVLLPLSPTGESAIPATPHVTLQTSSGAPTDGEPAPIEWLRRISARSFSGRR